MTTRTMIKAKDLMRTSVITLRPDDSLQSAIETLEEHKIGGAPVVDGIGQLVGMLTSSDIARFAATRGQRGDDEPYDFGESSDEEADERGEDSLFMREDYSPEILGRESVASWMNPRVISVTPETSMTQLCRTMSRAGTHRVVVADGKKLLGIVSSFDIVRCVAGGD